MRKNTPEELLKAHLKKSIEVKDNLFVCAPQVDTAAQILLSAVQAGNKILLCGNGGSAANADHFASDLLGTLSKSSKPRPAIAAIAISSNSTAITAIANNRGIERVFSRQIDALGKEGDVFVIFTTSGNSPNILAAVQSAKEKGMKIIGLTGATGGGLVPQCDACIRIPSNETALIQEAQLCIQHVLLEFVEGCICDE
ncbi:MAG: SIS domain-containing protein [Candidatus Micrarchaeia archaeon]|jgi:D-sedoheptulose 7-phosphate isomerase